MVASRVSGAQRGPRRITAEACQCPDRPERRAACRAELAYVIHRKLRAPSALGVTRWTVPRLYSSFHQTFAEDSRTGQRCQRDLLKPSPERCLKNSDHCRHAIL
eukprot:jgi/Tetstr1/421264/TSEL_001137.t1